jgi:hypothetical protein
MEKFLKNIVLRPMLLGLILLALGCNGGNYASQTSAHLWAYEGNPAGKLFGPPGG